MHATGLLRPITDPSERYLPGSSNKRVDRATSNGPPRSLGVVRWNGGKRVNKSGTSVRKALSLRFVQTGVGSAVAVATVTIVSRLLTPSEIGVYSVAVAFVALVQMLRDFGVSEFVVQEKVLSDDLVRSAFTLNLIIAWVLAVALFGLSGLIGDFYGDPGVARVTRVISLVFVLMPFGTTTMACMRREMHFDVILMIQTAETLARGGTTIALAYLGFSYMSMAWASVAGMLVLVTGCAFFGGFYRVRGLGFTDWKRVLHFGTNRTIADIAAQLGEQSANIVVGRMLGMAAAGFYSRGYGIVNIFRTNVVGAIGTVAFPAYAREHRDSNTAPQLYKKSLVYMTGICWPFFAFCTLMAYPIIRITFGSQWDASVPLMRWLCGAAILGTLIYQCNGLLTAVGCYREVTRIEIQYQLARLVLAVLAAFYSLAAVAASQILVYVVAITLYYRKLGRYEVLKLGPLMDALKPSAALTVFTCLAPAAVLLLWGESSVSHYIAAFFVATAGAGAAWLSGIFLFKHPMSSEIKNALSAMRIRLGTIRTGLTR